MILTRRSLVTGLGALIAAPAIVRYASLMPVKAMPALTYEIIASGVLDLNAMIEFECDQSGMWLITKVVDGQRHEIASGYKVGDTITITP